MYGCYGYCLGQYGSVISFGHDVLCLTTNNYISTLLPASTMLRVTPIYGSRLDERGPSNTSRCTLIEYGGVSVLWNVGWTDSLPRLPEHQALILSDSTLGCMGGLPLYHQKFPSIPAFATFPTVKMGQMALYDQHASLCLDGTRPPFSLFLTLSLSLFLSFSIFLVLSTHTCLS